MPTLASPALTPASDRAASSSQPALAPAAPINGESSSDVPKPERTIKTPKDLVEAYKRNGTFDSMRTELLKAFIASPQGDRFSERIEDIIADHFHCYASRSPSRMPSSSNSLPDSASTMRELERHTAYDRAEDDMERYQLDGRIGDIEADLMRLLNKDQSPARIATNGVHRTEPSNDRVDGQDDKATEMVLDDQIS